MDNAVKYSNQNPEIKIQSKENSKGLTLKFTDNGCGIPESDLPFVFDKFYRVHTGNLHDVKGFGLGLSYVKKIVDLHKGTIHAESELGKGTKFIITLPIIKN